MERQTWLGVTLLTEQLHTKIVYVVYVLGDFSALNDAMYFRGRSSTRQFGANDISLS